DYRPDRVQPSPRHEQGARCRPRIALRNGLQSVVRRLDADQSIRPIRKNEHRAHDPAPISAAPCCEETKRCRYSSQGCLHRVTSIVAGLPFLEQTTVVERQACGVLSEIDVESCAGKSRSKNKCQLAKKHRSYSL